MSNVIGEITNSSPARPLVSGKSLSGKRTREMLPRQFSKDTDYDDIENDASVLSRSHLTTSNLHPRDSLGNGGNSGSALLGSANRKDMSASSLSKRALGELKTEDSVLAEVSNKPKDVVINQGKSGISSSLNASPEVNNTISVPSGQIDMNSPIPKRGQTENSTSGDARVTFAGTSTTSDNNVLKSLLATWESTSKVRNDKSKTPSSASVSKSRTPGSTKRDDEIERLRKVLLSQGHWKVQCNALERITEMLQADMVDGEGLLRLAQPVRSFLLSSLSRLVLAACSCVEAACEYTSSSSKVPKKDFRAFSKDMVAPLCTLAGSLSTGCKASQDAGLRCLYNLYLANPELSLAHVFGQGSMGRSKNVAARRTAATFLFNLIHDGNQVQAIPQRDDALAEALISFFMDSDAETRTIARRALREIMLFRPITWIEEKVLSVLRDRCSEEQVPYLKQFALEYPDTGRSLGIEGARSSNLSSAIKSARKVSASDVGNSPDGDVYYMMTPAKTPASIVSLTTTAATNRYRHSTPISDIKPFPQRMNENLDNSELDEMLLRAHYANRPVQDEQAIEEPLIEEQPSELGESLRRARYANRPKLNNEVESLENTQHKEFEEADSLLDEELLKAHYANRPQAKIEEEVIVAEFTCLAGDQDSSPQGESLRARKMEQRALRMQPMEDDTVNEVAPATLDPAVMASPTVDSETLSWKRILLIGFVAALIVGCTVGFAFSVMVPNVEGLMMLTYATGFSKVEAAVGLAYDIAADEFIPREDAKLLNPEDIVVHVDEFVVEDERTVMDDSISSSLENQNEADASMDEHHDDNVIVNDAVAENQFIAREDAALLVEETLVEEDDWAVASEPETLSDSELTIENEVVDEASVSVENNEIPYSDEMADAEAGVSQVSVLVIEQEEVSDQSVENEVNDRAIVIENLVEDSVLINTPSEEAEIDSSVRAEVNADAGVESENVIVHNKEAVVAEEHAQPSRDNQTSASNALGVLAVLFFAVFFMRPSGNGESNDGYGAEEEQEAEAEEEPSPSRRSTRRRVSPPKGRFQAIEVTEDAVRPVVRSRRVVEPEAVTVQELDGRGDVTIITPRRPRRSARTRSKSR